MKTTLRSMVLAAIAAMVMLGGVVGETAAQSNNWNALFDRIIRLEHEVRTLRSAGGGGGGAASGDLSYRLTAIEDQLRQLIGSVGSMRDQMRDMQQRIQRLETQRSGQASNRQFTQNNQSGGTGLVQNQDVFQSGSTSTFERYDDEADGLDLTVLPEGSQTSEPLQPQVQFKEVPGSQVLGQLTLQNDSGLPGSGLKNNSLVPDQVETAALGTIGGGNAGASGGGAGAEDQFQRAHKNLLRRRFGLAEAGFKTFLNQNPKHASASKARYWLGETYYVQGKFKKAAQNFLTGYKAYPRGSRAAASLLKLGMSLNKLGQKKQACGAYAEVRRSYPNAPKVRKQAQREIKRAGC